MSQSNRTARRARVLEATQQTLAPPPSSIGVDWMAAALSQMAAPLPQAASHRAIGMFNALESFPTALIGIWV